MNELTKKTLYKLGITKGSTFYQTLRTLRNISMMPLAKFEELFGIKLYGWEIRIHSNKYFGTDKNAYNKLYSKNAQWWGSDDSEIRRAVIRILSQGSIPNLDKILDLGCGHARTLARLSYDLANLKGINLEEIKLIGLDFSSVALKLAKHHNFKKGINLELVCGDMTHTPFEDNSFSLIISKGSHEHLEKPNFKEVRRILRDDGFFLCLVPIVGDNEPEIIWEIHNVQRQNEFKKQTWINILKRDGFKIVDLLDGIFIYRTSGKST